MLLDSSFIQLLFSALGKKYLANAAKLWKPVSVITFYKDVVRLGTVIIKNITSKLTKVKISFIHVTIRVFEGLYK